MPELRAITGGVSNSRPTATSGHDRPAGFDTVRFRFRDNRARYDGLRVESGVVELARGEVRRTSDGVSVGAFPSGMVYVEGRAAALLDGSDAHYLADRQELGRAALAAWELAGVDATPSAVGIGRADLTSELRYDDGRDGLDVLRAAAAADLPWCKTGVEGLKGGVPQTVYWRAVNGRSVIMRLYDKGVETGDAAPGEWLRMERQRRYRREKEPAITDYHELDLRGAFVGRELAALVERRPELHVCDELGAITRVRELVEQELVTPRVAESLIGYLWLRGRDLPARTVRRRESTLRELGIALDRGTVERRVVGFADVLGRFADNWQAAA